MCKYLSFETPEKIRGSKFWQRDAVVGEEFVMWLKVILQARVISQVDEAVGVPCICHAVAGPSDLAVYKIGR
jgi:hypothetical protein